MDEIKRWNRLTSTGKAKVWARLFLTTFYGFKAVYYTIAMCAGMAFVGIFLLCGCVWRLIRQLARRFRLE